MPGQCGRGAGGTGGRLPGFLARDDGDGRIGDAGARQPGALGGGEDLERIHERAARRDDEAARHGQREIDVAVLEVELALTEVLLGVPAPHVVVDREPRVPLGDLVQPPRGEVLPAHAVGAVLGDLEGEGELHRDRSAGRQRTVEIGPEHGAVRGRRERRAPQRRVAVSRLRSADRAQVGDRVAALKAARRPAGVRGVDEAPAAVLAVDVLVRLKPHVAQAVGRVIGVADRLLPRHRVRPRIERRADRIVHALLPVARPGCTGAGAIFVRRRQGEPPERRGVPDPHRDRSGSGGWWRRGDGLLQDGGEEQRHRQHAG